MFDESGRGLASVSRGAREPVVNRPTHKARPDDSLLIDRDLSLIEFERRVLEEARDQRNPLLERVKFLAILGRNLDEFVMVRGNTWIAAPCATRLTRALHALLRNGQRVFQRHLVPALAEAGIHLVDYAALADDERADVDRRFTEAVLPLVAPVFCDTTHVPDAPNLGLNLAVVIHDERHEARLALVRVPDQLSSLVPFTPSGTRPAMRRGPLGSAMTGLAMRRGPLGSAMTRCEHEAFVWLDQVLLANLHRVFPGARVESAHLFRIVRDADVVLAPTSADELPDRIIEAVRQRETNPIMMMVIDGAAGAAVIDRLAQALSIQPETIVRARAVLDLKRLWDFSRVPRPDLRYPALVPHVPPRRAGGCMFAAIRTGDILLHHPYESFQPVVDLLRQAVDDPDVLSISTTLYRTDRGESPFVEALLDAARRGKQVCVIVELTARFDERRNAEWARALKAAGVRVFHPSAGLKGHAKTTLIVRREGDDTRRYVHMSTGNYSSFTSTVYTDLALLTCDEAIAADVADLFECMTSDRQTPILRTVLAAPFALRAGFTALVEREIAWAARGEAGHIVLKMNALVDRAKIELLHRASQAGVQVDLIVRGVCCLRPGVPGISDRIRVRSIVGRFLEHSRAWYFRNGGTEEVFIGSADLMPRNFDRRIEVVMPLKDRALAHRVRYGILGIYLADTLSARELGSDGRYSRVAPRPGEPGVSSQRVLLDTPV